MDDNSKSIILAIVLSVLVLLGWNIMFPPTDVVQAPNAQVEQTQQTASGDKVNDFQLGVVGASVSADEVVATTDRVFFDTPSIQGSIAVTGARIDDVVLKKYKQQNTDDSPNVRLLSPTNTPNGYAVNSGWVGKKDFVPNHKTVWAVDSDILSVGSDVVFSWTNPQGVVFKKIFSIDENYMISIQQLVENNSGNAISIANYGSIFRKNATEGKLGMYILHEGPIGVFDNTLSEIDYDDVVDAKGGIESFETTGGWLGFTDQFWQVAFIPAQDSPVTASFRYLSAYDAYQADFMTVPGILNAGDVSSYKMNVFSGAKEVSVIDVYAEKYTIPMFDRSIDFGWFYFLTKPFFYLLHFLSEQIGNVGFAILAITLIVKAVLFPLANKSYKSMAKMKLLAPQIEALKKQHGDDRQAMSQAMMKLYKQEKVNPMSGCLPMVIQIPIFFSLYKVLFVTIEVRHAPFIGWVKDLSAQDPLTVLTGFGLFSWQVPDILNIVNLGIWPILMGISMWAQFRLNPTPSDPVQAKVFAWMPVIFTFMLATFPVGLVIYWTWNNILTIIQQYTIQRRLGVQ